MLKQLIAAFLRGRELDRIYLLQINLEWQYFPYASLLETAVTRYASFLLNV